MFNVDNIIFSFIVKKMCIRLGKTIPIIVLKEIKLNYFCSKILSMNAEYESVLLKLQAKTEKLIALYAAEKEKNSRLSQEVEHFKLSLSENKTEVETLKTKYENLRLAGAILAESDGNSNEARQRLNRIIREIDQCIALLNR